MINIFLSDIKCNVETDEVGADEPFVLVTAVDLEPNGLVPAFEVVRYGPFQGVDKNEKHLAPGIAKSFWNVNNNPASIQDPNDVIFAVALMENDDGNAETLRGIVKGSVGVSLLASSTFDRNSKVTKLINDINAALGIPTGAPNFDDKVGTPKELRFSLAEINQAEAGIPIRKTLNFVGDGGNYTLGFEARNPNPVQVSGDLLWYRHIGWGNGGNNWANNGNNIKVKNGFQNFKSVCATSEGVIYAIQPNGDLMWFKHNNWQDGVVNWANNGTGIKVKSGFQNFISVFATSSGVIYGIQPNGDLIWFKHNGWQTGTNNWANSGNGIKVGNSWQNFKTVFATSSGVIYAIKPDGKLLWYKHNGWQSGTSSWATGSSKEIGNTWQNYKSVFAASNGVIYAILTNGDLLWFHHTGWQTGGGTWANIHGTKVGNGWQNFKFVFATNRVPLNGSELSHWGPECVVYGVQT